MDVEDQAPLRVAVLSRYALMRVGLTALVNAHPSRAVVVDVAAQDGHIHHADVALYDLAGLNTDENCTDLEHLLGGDIAVVGLARDGRSHLSERARALGVRSIVEEQITSETLLAALEGAARPATHDDELPQRPPALTDRELSVLQLVAAGKLNKEIADELFLSIN